MSAKSEAEEVGYEVRFAPSGRVAHRDIAVEVLKAVQAFRGKLVGVRAEPRTSDLSGTAFVVTLLISGNYDGDRLDQLWREHLAPFGLTAERKAPVA
jgi:hypothetical protein